MALAVSTAATPSYAQNSTSCEERLRLAKVYAGEAIENAEEAARLMRLAQGERDAAIAQRDTYRQQRDGARVERDNLSGQCAALGTQADTLAAENYALVVRVSDMRARDAQRWSPVTWLGIGVAGSALVYVALRFLVAPQFGL